MAFSQSLSVPQYNANGSVSPIALGTALQIMGSGGWVVNNGSSTIYLVRVGDGDALTNPIGNGIPLEPNARLALPAAAALSEFGLLADSTGGSAFVLGT